MDSYLEQLQQAIASATHGISSEELRRHPDGHLKGKWSAAEVLEHLYLTYTGTVKGLERVLQTGKPLASPITLKQRVRITLVIKLSYFPKGRKAPERATLAICNWKLSDLPKWLTPDVYLKQIQPALASVATSQISSSLGVSEPYASGIRKGRRCPHPRHWQALAELVGMGRVDIHCQNCQLPRSAYSSLN